MFPSGSNELVTPHLDTLFSNPKPSPLPFAPCCILIPPSPVAADPDANPINLSAIFKSAVASNDAVPLTVKFLWIRASLVIVISLPIVTSSGKLIVAFTSVPTFVIAVVISLVVPRICKSSSVKDTGEVPESPSTVKVVAIPVKSDPSPWYDPLNEPLNIPSPVAARDAEVAVSAWEAVKPDLIVPAKTANEAEVAIFAIEAVPAVCDADNIILQELP